MHDINYSQIHKKKNRVFEFLWKMARWLAPFMLACNAKANQRCCDDPAEDCPELFFFMLTPEPVAIAIHGAREHNQKAHILIIKALHSGSYK